jgi:hypothetical protein
MEERVLRWPAADLGMNCACGREKYPQQQAAHDGLDLKPHGIIQTIKHNSSTQRNFSTVRTLGTAAPSLVLES